MKFIFTLILTVHFSILNATTLPTTFTKDTTEVYKDHILYRVTDDASTIYVTVRTSDRATMRKWLRSGFTLYFDTKGKKKKDVFVKYTSKNPQEGMEKKGANSLPDSEQSKRNFNTLVQELPQEAIYGYFDEEHHFHKDLNSLNIGFQWNYFDTNELLEFQLKLPKQRILKENESNLSKLTVGMVFNTKQSAMSKKQGVQMQSSGMGQGGGRGRGSGMHGGGGGMKGSGTGSPKKNSGNQSQNSEYWFEANLSR